MKHLFIPAALLVLFIPAFAEENTLETVVVTATRSDQTTVITPTSVSVITREQLDSMAASSLVDILRSQAGIQISDLIGNGSRATVSMRGFGANAANNTLIMIDGRKLNNPSQEAPNLSAIALNDIERIEIIEGGGGVLYGDQAVGGVINIITRKPEKDPYVHVETSVGSHDLQTLRGSASQIFSNGFAYRLAAEDTTRDNYRDNNEANYSNYFSRLEQNGERGQLFVEFQTIDDELNLPGSLTQVQVNTDRNQTLTPADYSNYNTDMYRLGGNLTLTDEWSLLAEASDRDSDLNGLITFFTSDTFEQDTHVRTVSPRLVGKLETSQGTTHITLGYDWQDSDYQYRSTNFFAIPKDSVQEIDAFYGQIIYPFDQNLSFAGGLRQSSVSDENKLNGNDNNDDEITTEAGINWTSGERLRAFVRRAEILRFANADDNAFTLPGVDFLNAQTGVSNEAGFELTEKQWKVKATLFDMDINDEIYFDAFLFANINLPDSNRKGLLLSGEYEVSRDLTLGANYTRTDTEITEGSFEGNEVPFVAQNTGTTYVIWNPLKDIQVYADALYTGSRYRADDDGNVGSRVEGYWIYNLALRRDWQQLHGTLRLNNIGGEKYSTLQSIYDYQYPAPEETLELTIGYDF